MRLLLVEDDEPLGSGIRDALERNRYLVEWLRDGALGLEALRSGNFDLAVLDLGLPRLDGMEVLRKAREAGVRTPVLVLSARDTTTQRIGGLDAGADDYMVKPIRRMELLARVEALLRRTRSRAAELTNIEIGPYRIDLSNRTILVDAEWVEMTDKEFELAVFLFRNLGQLMSRGHITESVWGRSADVQSRTVDTHISRLRKKLDLGNHRGVRLTPVYNFGYRLEKVAVSGEAPATDKPEPTE